MKLHMSMDTAASAEQVLAVLTEGTSRPNTWARERYDWSVDGVVAWHAAESNFCKPGSGITVQIAQLPDGGSHLEIEWDRTPSNLRWSLMFLPMRLMLPKAWQPVFDRLAA